MNATLIVHEIQKRGLTAIVNGDDIQFAGGTPSTGLIACVQSNRKAVLKLLADRLDLARSRTEFSAVDFETALSDRAKSVVVTPSKQQRCEDREDKISSISAVSAVSAVSGTRHISRAVRLKKTDVSSSDITDLSYVNRELSYEPENVVERVCLVQETALTALTALSTRRPWDELVARNGIGVIVEPRQPMTHARALLLCAIERGCTIRPDGSGGLLVQYPDDLGERDRRDIGNEVGIHAGEILNLMEATS